MINQIMNVYDFYMYLAPKCIKKISHTIVLQDYMRQNEIALIYIMARYLISSTV